MQLFVLVNWDSSSVVLYGYRFVLVDGYFDVCAVSCHCLVDGVVHSLVYQVVKSFFTYVTDVHCRAFAHGFESLQHLNVAGGIIIFVYLIL